MSRRPVLGGSKRAVAGEKRGFVIAISTEAQALERWRLRQFLELERLHAKAWREMLAAPANTAGDDFLREAFGKVWVVLRAVCSRWAKALVIVQQTLLFCHRNEVVELGRVTVVATMVVTFEIGPVCPTKTRVRQPHAMDMIDCLANPANRPSMGQKCVISRRNPPRGHPIGWFQLARAAEGGEINALIICQRLGTTVIDWVALRTGTSAENPDANSACVLRPFGGFGGSCADKAARLRVALPPTSRPSTVRNSRRSCFISASLVWPVRRTTAG